MALGDLCYVHGNGALAYKHGGFALVYKSEGPGPGPEPEHGDVTIVTTLPDYLPPQGGDTDQYEPYINGIHRAVESHTFSPSENGTYTYRLRTWYGGWSSVEDETIYYVANIKTTQVGNVFAPATDMPYNGKVKDNEMSLEVVVTFADWQVIRVDVHRL